MESVEAKQNTMNQRLYDRNVPTGFLQPYLDFRPAMTKYTYLPIVEPHVQTPAPQQQPTYNPHQTFNPGSRAPWSGYQVNTESILRNQIYALQKGSQAVYVPSSTSDLYAYSMPKPQQQQQQPHPFLADNWIKQSQQQNKQQQHSPGPGLFFNDTRSLAKPEAPI
jgi:hypothetical protein